MVGHFPQAYSTSKILEISITELVFLLLFGVLAFTYFSDQEHLTEVTNTQKQIEILKKNVVYLKATFDKQRKKIFSLNEENKKLKKEIEVLERMITDATIKEGSGPNAQDIIKKLQNQIKSLMSENIGLEEKVKLLTKRISSLHSQLKKSGKGGVGNPQCYLRPSDRTETLLSVTMYNDGFMVKPEWDQRVTTEALAIPGIKVLIQDKLISPGEFKRAGMKIYLWENRQDPQCRFFVSLYNQADQVKPLIRNRQLVEDVFYIKKKY